MPEKITIPDLLAKKQKGEKIAMLTAYDYPMAALVDQSGIDIVLVGDSLANVVLGLESTKEVGMFEMLHHAKAARRAVKRALLVGDMPFEAYQTDVEQAVANARRFISEAGCDAVKIEWFERCPEVTERLVQAGIPVMGHIGLTPQTADKLGGFKVQGRTLEAAQKIIEQAHTLEEKGIFSLVIECVPQEVARVITEDLSVPTIGIGAGPACDGQVLVINDLLGLFDRHRPKFVKRYADLNPLILESLKTFRKEVEEGRYPDKEHSYSMSGPAAGSVKGSVTTGRGVGPAREDERFRRFLRAVARNMLVASRAVIKRMPRPVFQAGIYPFIGLGYCLMLKKRKIALGNLRRVFGREKTEQELQKIAGKCFRDFGRGMVEVIYYADRLRLIPEVVEIEGKEHLDKALEAGRGAILVSAHFGNFLLMYFRLICEGYKTNVIMRRVRDEQFENYISDFRRSLGLNAIYDLPSRRCVQESLRALRNNEVLFILLDQNYGTDGRVFVDFMGQKAATATGPVIFSCRTHAPVLPVFMMRQGKDKHKIAIEPPVPMEKCANEQDTLLTNVSRITKIIEEHILCKPEMWGGWMHNRWKSRPADEQTLLNRLSGNTGMVK